VRDGVCGQGADWQGDARWLRLTELWTATAKAEVYPSLWMKRYPRRDRDGDSYAAYAAAAWMKRADQNGSLATFLNPPLEPHERLVSEIEGWILGAV
jgi:hypothetical protein